jgi:TonB family protein
VRPVGDVSSPRTLTTLLFVVWAASSLGGSVRRVVNCLRARTARRTSLPLESGRVADALARLLSKQGGPRVALHRAPLCASPCVAGIFRPAILWPDDVEVEQQLTDAQIEAILAHELAHVRRRDNVAAAAHGIVEILFWFHPLVWWLSARLRDERERACDDEVLRSTGVAPELYAAGILTVCETAIGAPIAAAAITGSPLTQRIEAIMTPHSPRVLDPIRRTLGIAAIVALTVLPVAAGALSKPPVQGPGRTITGRVVDPMGATVAGATLTATSAASGMTRSAVSDENGRYTLTDLPPGEVTIIVKHSGFRTIKAPMAPATGVPTKTDFQLQVGAVSEAVTVRSSGVGREDPAVSAATEAELLARVSQATDAVAAELALAALYYRQERFAESQAAMARATELIAQRAAAQRASRPDVVVTSSRGGGDITEPRKIRDVKPIYPEIARAARVSGVVIIEATIAEDGTVRDARVLRGVPLLDEAALGAVRQWLFTPTLLNGVPVEVVITASVRFVE